jgi:ssDNA-binding Zn-finger/Zn-ribbon topoisomerase 1
MGSQSWHASFNPQKFLSRVNVEKLIEHNDAYNENKIEKADKPCFLCSGNDTPGLLLNDKSYLCKNCFDRTATISYPEKYEKLRRKYLQDKEARRIALEDFTKTFGYSKPGNPYSFFSWLSIVLIFFHIGFIYLTIALFVVSSFIESSQNRKLAKWKNQFEEWNNNYPEPKKPLLRHFHDPSAELSITDQKILKIFNNWPGYPPFWQYLREVVIARDNNRCQVTGCPSRLSLHVHHRMPVAKGGEHIPNNLVSLCDFHHALEPAEGHERIWGNVKTKFFTLVRAHERQNRAIDGYHHVKAHLRRLELVSLQELKDLNRIFGFCCPDCGSAHLKFTLYSTKNQIRVSCKKCNSQWEGPQQLTEESGPLLSEVLKVTKSQGSWKARWDMLSQRKISAFKSMKFGKGSSGGTKNKKTKTIRSTPEAIPTCPKCGSAMRLIKPRPDQKWEKFWGCAKYNSTGCRGSANI